MFVHDFVVFVSVFVSASLLAFAAPFLLVHEVDSSLGRSQLGHVNLVVRRRIAEVGGRQPSVHIGI
jgi:hypothetical protein